MAAVMLAGRRAGESVRNTVHHAASLGTMSWAVSAIACRWSSVDDSSSEASARNATRPRRMRSSSDRRSRSSDIATRSATCWSRREARSSNASRLAAPTPSTPVTRPSTRNGTDSCDWALAASPPRTTRPGGTVSASGIATPTTPRTRSSPSSSAIRAYAASAATASLAASTVARTSSSKSSFPRSRRAASPPDRPTSGWTSFGMPSPGRAWAMTAPSPMAPAASWLPGRPGTGRRNQTVLSPDWYVTPHADAIAVGRRRPRPRSESLSPAWMAGSGTMRAGCRSVTRTSSKAPASRQLTSSLVPACWTPLATSSLTSSTASSIVAGGSPHAPSASRVNERARDGTVGSGEKNARAVRSPPSATSHHDPNHCAERDGYIAFGDRVTGQSCQT